MNQIVLRVGKRLSEFYFPQNETGFYGIEEVIMDIVHDEKTAKEASLWCEKASLGDRLEKNAFNLEIRA